MERRGIKIGFLGYCDFLSVNKNCTEMRMLFNSGPAIYRDNIATRDVKKLKQVKHTQTRISVLIYPIKLAGIVTWLG